MELGLESRFPLFLRATYLRVGASAPPPLAYTCCCVARAGTSELEGLALSLLLLPLPPLSKPYTGQTRESGANSLSGLPLMHPPVYTCGGCCCQIGRYLMLLLPNLLRLRFVYPRAPGAFQCPTASGPRPLGPSPPPGRGRSGERCAIRRHSGTCSLKP